jgi:hypothetical protein
MKYKIGVSTGIFARLMPEEELEKMVNILLDYHVELIEILVARPRLADIRFSQKTLDRLRTIEVSIHAPFFKEEGYEDVDLDAQLLSRVEKFAIHVNAEDIVIHPDLVRDWDRVKQIRIPVLIENLKPGRGWGLNEMKDLIKKNPTFGIALDGDHAEKWGVGEADIWAKELYSNLKSLHLNLKDQYKCIVEGDWVPPKYVLMNTGSIILEKTPFEMDAIPTIIIKAKEIINQYHQIRNV